MAYQPKREPLGPCPVELVIAIVGGKWKARILESLEQKEKTFADLRRSLPGVTQQVLTAQLRGLERDRIVQREQTSNERGPCSVYSLAERGRSLLPVLHVVAAWGTDELRKAGLSVEPRELRGSLAVGIVAERIVAERISAELEQGRIGGDEVGLGEIAALE